MNIFIKKVRGAPAPVVSETVA